MTCETIGYSSNANSNNDTEKRSSDPVKEHRIAVIGGGPAGLAFCLQLFDKLQNSQLDPNVRIKITLFERSNEIGPGLAYSSRPANKASLLLNTTKDAMSPMKLGRVTALVGKYGDFSDWLAEWEKRENAPKSTDFPPRYMFGLYLKHLFDQLQHKLASPNNRMLSIDFLTSKTVTKIQKVQQNSNGNEFVVDFEENQTDENNNNDVNPQQQIIFADQVVLCVGHLPIDSYRQFIGLPKYGHDLESNEQCLRALKGHESVGIVGTKLSAIDLALMLRAQGHWGPIWMASRTGLMPAVFNPLSLFVFEQQQMKDGPTFGLTTLDYSNQSANNLVDGKKWLSIKYLQGVDQKERKFFENNPKSDRLLLCRMGENDVFISTPAQITSDKNEDKLFVNSADEKTKVLTKPKCSNFSCISAADQIMESFLHDVKRIEQQLGRNGCSSDEYNLQEEVERILSMSPMEWLNKGIAQCEKGPAGWQLAMFSIWEIIPQIWQQLPLLEKKRFMRRWYSLFGAYYAPFPLENALRIREMLASGQLKVLNGVGSILWNGDEMGKSGHFLLSGKAPENSNNSNFTVKVDFLLNGTGPGFEAKNLPLIADLIEAGMAQPNQFGGIVVDTKTLRVMPKSVDTNIQSINEPSNCNELYAIGELTKGHFLTTACMSKVSQQVDKLTAHIVAQLALQIGILLNGKKYKLVKT